jgi:hypothetical protein
LAPSSSDRTTIVARYYLHRRTPVDYIIDPEGSELPDLAAAHHEAILCARQFWSGAILVAADLSDESFEISDADGRLLLSVPFLDALPASLRR